MKSILLSLLALPALAVATTAAPKIDAGSDAESTAAEKITVAPGYERVDYISALRGFYSFKAVDRETLIVWTSPSMPYLIKLALPSPDLRFAHAIAIDRHSARVYEGFDSIRIEGLRYPIDEIYRLTREQARAL
jgi:hypothetical protein